MTENVRMQFETSSQRLAEIESLMKECGIETRKDFFNNAFTMMKWAIQQIKDGRIIVSLDEKQKKFSEFQMPIFSHVEVSREPDLARSQPSVPETGHEKALKSIEEQTPRLSDAAWNRILHQRSRRVEETETETQPAYGIAYWGLRDGMVRLQVWTVDEYEVAYGDPMTVWMSPNQVMEMIEEGARATRLAMKGLSRE